MKTKLHTLFAALLALGLSGCAQAPPAAETKPADTKAADTAAIKALEDRFLAAFKAKDVNGIMTVYVPDDSLFVFDAVPPRQYVGAQAYRKDWEGLMALFPGPIDVDFSDIDVTVGGGRRLGAAGQSERQQCADERLFVCHRRSPRGVQS